VSTVDVSNILVVDDHRAIHEDFRKILLERAADDNLQELEAALFGESAAVALSAPQAFRLDSAYQGAEALQLVQRSIADHQPYAVAFVDMRMPPGWDGLQTIEHLWNVDPDIQIVICSAYTDHDWRDLIARLGMSNKLLVLKKPFDVIEVLQCAHALSSKWRNERVLRKHVESLERDVSERAQRLESANRQLRHLATHDALTSLPNRVLLDDRLSHAIAHAQRTGENFAVAVLDLDRFKLVNDSLGHRAGDELLQGVARRLSAALRGVDTVARLGGDEFVMIITQTGTRTEAGHVARKVLDALQTSYSIGDHEIHTSASIGIAMYPGDGASIETLYAHADAAMYCAKQRGGSGVEYFVPSMSVATGERMRLETELHRALQRGQFELYYQPKLDAATHRIHSVEALIRWRHPERGLIPPDQFIPLAEDSGLIVPIGAWVLREACRQVRAWQSAGMRQLRVAVNLSALQFRRLDLSDTVQAALDDAGLDARSLEIELTESAVMSNPEESVEILERLSRMGVIVSVDDFGTGHSSISYLRRFPIDKLKIDRGFIANVMTSADDAAIVQAIISLAHSLRLKVVAEGVETLEQAEFLRRHGCDEFQGYYFCRPIQAGALLELLRTATAGAVEPLPNDSDRTYSKLSIIRPGFGGR
jgi:diguanylate cyclase (GGDEF)-like protein